MALLATDRLACAYLVDLVGEVRAGGHVCDAERLVGRVVEEALVEGGGEEAQRRTAVDQGEGQQAAHVEVQVLVHSCTHKHRALESSDFASLLLQTHSEARIQSIITRNNKIQKAYNEKQASD